MRNILILIFCFLSTFAIAQNVNQILPPLDTGEHVPVGEAGTITRWERLSTLTNEYVPDTVYSINDSLTSRIDSIVSIIPTIDTDTDTSIAGVSFRNDSLILYEYDMLTQTLTDSFSTILATTEDFFIDSIGLRNDSLILYQYERIGNTLQDSLLKDLSFYADNFYTVDGTITDGLRTVTLNTGTEVYFTGNTGSDGMIRAENFGLGAAAIFKGEGGGRAMDLFSDDAATSTSEPILTLRRENSSATPVSGYGAQIEWYLSNTGGNALAAEMDVRYLGTLGSGTEDADWRLRLRNSSTLNNILGANSDGTIRFDQYNGFVTGSQFITTNTSSKYIALIDTTLGEFYMIHPDSIKGTGGASGDNWGSQVVESDVTLLGTGIIGNLLKVDTTLIATKYDIDTITHTVDTDTDTAINEMRIRNDSLFIIQWDMLTQTNQDSFGVDLSPYLDNVNDIDYISNVQLLTNDLTFTGVGNAFAGSIDLSGYLDDTDTDTAINAVAIRNDSLFFYQWDMLGQTLQDSLNVDLSPYLDNVNDIDYVSNVALNTLSLDFTGVGNAFNGSVDLSSIQDDWGTQVVESDITLLGDGTLGNVLKVDTTLIATQYYSDNSNIDSSLFNYPRARDSVVVDTVDWDGGLKVIDLSTLSNSNGDTLEFFLGNVQGTGAGSVGEVHFHVDQGGTNTPRLRIENYLSSWRFSTSRDGLIDYGYNLQLGANFIARSNGGITMTAEGANLTGSTQVIGDNVEFKSATDENATGMSFLTLAAIGTSPNSEGAITLHSKYNDGGRDIGFAALPASFGFARYAYVGESTSLGTDTSNFVAAGRTGTFINTSDGLFLRHPATAIFTTPLLLPYNAAVDSILAVDRLTGEVFLKSQTTITGDTTILATKYYTDLNDHMGIYTGSDTIRAGTSYLDSDSWIIDGTDIEFRFSDVLDGLTIASSATSFYPTIQNVRTDGLANMIEWRNTGDTYANDAWQIGTLNDDFEMWHWTTPYGVGFELFSLEAVTGHLTLARYGQDTIKGTPATIASFTSSGKVVEIDPDSLVGAAVGQSGVNYYNNESFLTYTKFVNFDWGVLGSVEVDTVNVTVDTTELETLFYVPRIKDSVVVDTVDWDEQRYISLDDTLTFLYSVNGTVADGGVHFVNPQATFDHRLKIVNDAGSSWTIQASRDAVADYSRLNLGINATLEGETNTTVSALDGDVTIQGDDAGGNMYFINSVNGTDAGVRGDFSTLNGGANAVIGELENNSGFFNDTTNFISVGINGTYFNSPDGYFYHNPSITSSQYSLPSYKALDTMQVVNPANGQIHTYSFDVAADAWAVANNITADVETKAITIEDPTNAENVSMFFTDVAITITQVNDVVQGTTPSLTWDIVHATTRNNGTPNELFGTDRVTTSESGAETTSFTDATIPAGSWVWFVSSAQSGTTDEFNVTIEYTYD